MRTCRLLLSLLLLVIGLQSGCAVIRPGVRANTFNNGTPDPDRDEAIAKQAKDIKDTSHVEVVAGVIPKGLDVTEGGSKIMVAPGYEGQFEVLGTVESDYMKGNSMAFLKNFYWTWNYEEGWRKGLCWPQAPLKAVTLGLWNMLPWSWPCMATMPDETGRQKDHIAAIKRVAAAMGADLVVLTNSGDLSVTTVNARSGAVVGTSITKNMSLRGFAIRRRDSNVASRPGPSKL